MATFGRGEMVMNTDRLFKLYEMAQRVTLEHVKRSLAFPRGGDKHEEMARTTGGNRAVRGANDGGNDHGAGSVRTRRSQATVDRSVKRMSNHG
jgi:hypothetical protein